MHTVHTHLLVRLILLHSMQIIGLSFSVYMLLVQPVN